MLSAVAVALQRWPMVGRRSELEVFERALGSAELEGMLIHGRAGVGKTRLADECRQQAAASAPPTQRAAGHPHRAPLAPGAGSPPRAGRLRPPGPHGDNRTRAPLDDDPPARRP